MTSTSEALASVFRSEAGPLVASLARSLGDFALAEDAVQDAIVEALQHWPVSGVPEEPRAWLYMTSRRKALDRIRREARYRDKLQILGRLEASTAPTEQASVADDRLALIFLCCHPSISREAQVALTLRSVLGLTTAQLARAFLTNEETMKRRITRAKRKIVEAGISFGVPSRTEMNARLAEVLASVYLMFNEGYLATGPDIPERWELAADAQWLASLLEQALPDEPEVTGLTVLIKLNQARRRARFDRNGHLVLLKDQDRTLWDRTAIEDALRTLVAAMSRDQPGSYQTQAALAACHAIARRWEDTDWDRIVELYDILVGLVASPVVELNRAIALGHRDGPRAALAALEPLSGRLDGYYLFHAARAQLLRELGRTAEAALEDRVASQFTRNPAELHLLGQRVEGLA